MKRIVALLTVTAVMTTAAVGPASAQSSYCWAYDYYYGWYWYYC